MTTLNDYLVKFTQDISNFYELVYNLHFENVALQDSLHSNFKINITKIRKSVLDIIDDLSQLYVSNLYSSIVLNVNGKVKKEYLNKAEDFVLKDNSVLNKETISHVHKISESLGRLKFDYNKMKSSLFFELKHNKTKCFIVDNLDQNLEEISKAVTALVHYVKAK